MILNVILYPHYDKDLILLFSRESFSKTVRLVIHKFLDNDFEKSILPLSGPFSEDVSRKSYTVSLDEDASNWLSMVDRGCRSMVVKNLIRFYYLFPPVYLYCEGQEIPSFSVSLHGSKKNFSQKSSFSQKSRHNKTRDSKKPQDVKITKDTDIASDSSYSVAHNSDLDGNLATENFGNELEIKEEKNIFDLSSSLGTDF